MLGSLYSNNLFISFFIHYLTNIYWAFTIHHTLS